jgi:hypothetical protein
MTSPTTDERTYGCDNCNGQFVAEDMHTLGGDRFVEGFAPEAYPSECTACFESRLETLGW